MPYYNARLFGGDMEVLKSAIRHQVEYYFSVENLVKDMYIRALMDENQFVPLVEIAQFNRLLTLTNDINLVNEVIAESTIVEVVDGKVRRRENPEQFPHVEPTFEMSAPAFLPPWAQSFMMPMHHFDWNAPEFVPSSSFAANTNLGDDASTTASAEHASTAGEVSSATATAASTTGELTPSAATVTQPLPSEKKEDDGWVTKTPQKKVIAKPRTHAKPQSTSSKVRP